MEEGGGEDGGYVGKTVGSVSLCIHSPALRLDPDGSYKQRQLGLMGSISN